MNKEQLDFFRKESQPLEEIRELKKKKKEMRLSDILILGGAVVLAGAAMTCSFALSQDSNRTLREWRMDNFGRVSSSSGWELLQKQRGLFMYFHLRDRDLDGKSDLTVFYRGCNIDGEVIMKGPWKVYDHKTKIRYLDLNFDGRFTKVQTDGTGYASDQIPLCYKNENN